MSVSFEDPFTAIHHLMKREEFAEAILALIDARTGRINLKFRVDINHAWYCVADSKYKIGDFSGALSSFKKALKDNPNDVESLLAIANCYDELKKPKLAERFLRKALALNPKGRIKAAALVNLGNALMDQNRWTDAIDHFGELCKRKDDIGTIARKNRSLALDLRNRHKRLQI